MVLKEMDEHHICIEIEGKAREKDLIMDMLSKF